MNDRHNQNGDGIGSDEMLDAQLTAYALDQLEGEEREQVESLLAGSQSASARQHVEAIRKLASTIPHSRADAPALQGSADLRRQLIDRLNAQSSDHLQVELKKTEKRRWLGMTVVEWGVVAGIVCVLFALLLPGVQSARESASRAQREEWKVSATTPSPVVAERESELLRYQAPTSSAGTATSISPLAGEPRPDLKLYKSPAAVSGEELDIAQDFAGYAPGTQPTSGGLPALRGEHEYAEGIEVEAIPHSVDSLALLSDPQPKPDPATLGMPFGSVPAQQAAPLQQVVRQKTREVQLADGRYFKGAAYGLQSDGDFDGTTNRFALVPAEQYDAIVENLFLSPAQQPLSTFSIDVDTASYANVRRFLTSGRLPPPSAVRIEELVNYFRYDYPQPKGDDPFSVNMEMAECPWNEGHRLLRVGLKGKEIHRGERPESNLVFLLDVSGSMDEPNKLPLVKQSMTMLVQELTESDRVSIVTYAGNAGLVLPPTSGDQKRKILDAIESLSPGGSTHGSAGIQLAYDMAGEYFRKGGTNRVILATDGDLNVGVTSDEALVDLIKEKAKGGTFLTVLGFGEGNLKDSKMEKLADNGNGIYAYIDGAREGRKVLVEQMTGSLITIAKDVKIQIEFNPAEVASYRLLGYENRILAAQDFNDDKKDAGEIGAGHTVTALYEVVPVGAKTALKKEQADVPATDPLKYQAASKAKPTGEATSADDPRAYEPAAQLTDAAKNGELLTLKLRYKQPDGDSSKLLEYPLSDKGGSFNAASADMQFASAVASFGMVLRQSEHRGTSNLAAVEEIASGSLGKDDGGYRAEFVQLVKQAATMGIK